MKNKLFILIVSIILVLAVRWLYSQKNKAESLLNEAFSYFNKGNIATQSLNMRRLCSKLQKMLSDIIY